MSERARPLGQAFEQVDIIVSFSSFLDETTQYADLVLPDHTFLERWQDDFVEGMGYPGVHCANLWWNRCTTRATPAMC